MRRYYLSSNAPERGPSASSAATGVFVSVIVLFLLNSLFITSYHCHFDLSTRTHCAICKAADNLSADDNQKPVTVTPQEIYRILAVVTLPRSAYEIYVSLLNNRAPPA